MINKYYKWKDKVVFLSDLVFAEGVWKFVVYDCSPNLTKLNEALLWHPFQTKNTPYFINIEDFNYSDDLTATCATCIYYREDAICTLGKSYSGVTVPKKIYNARCRLRQDCLTVDSDSLGLFPACSYKQGCLLRFTGKASDNEDALLLRCRQLIQESSFAFIPAPTYYPSEQELFFRFGDQTEAETIIYSLAIDKIFENPFQLSNREWHIKRWTLYCETTFSKDVYFSDIINYDLAQVLISFDTHKVAFCPGGVEGYFFAQG